MRVKVRYAYSGASLLRTLYMNKLFFYYNCLCRLNSFNFWSVVKVVSERLTLQLFCAENLISL